MASACVEQTGGQRPAKTAAPCILLFLLCAITAHAGNVLLFVADDVGVDQVGLYRVGSHAKAVTPTINAIAVSGVVFTQAWANPSCSPSRASILTGKHAFEHGVGSAYSSELDPVHEIIPDVLLDRRSALFGKWHLGERATDWPNQLGWDTHIGTLGAAPNAVGHEDVQGYYFYDKYENGVLTGTYDSHRYATLETTEDAYRWIRAQGNGAPWFSAVAYNAAHSSKQESDAGKAEVWEDPPASCVPRPSTEEGSLRNYQNSVTCMDWSMGNLLAELFKIGMLKDTTVIFVSDNGTHNNGSESDFCCTRYYPKDRDKGTVYQGGVHVPLMIADANEVVKALGGGAVERGRRVSDPVHVVDIFATVVDLVGFAPEEPMHDFGSRSLRGYLEGTQAEPLHQHLYTESLVDNQLGRVKTCVQALRDMDYKLVRRISNVDGRIKKELYSLTNPDLCTGDCELEDAADELLATRNADYREMADRLEGMMPHSCDISTGG